MPRPSDLYATLGEPGVYQATSWTPCALPNVFVCPPEEDDEDVFCLFHSGSASPSAFEAFYRNSVYTQRDPSSPTFTDLTVLDHALSYIQQQASAGNDAPVFGRKLGWEDGDHVVMPLRSYSGSSTTAYCSNILSSGSVQAPIRAETTAFSNMSFLIEGEDQVEGQNVPCRRSSVFGERPSNYEAFGNLAQRNGGGRRPPVKKAQTMTLKSRAAIAFKAFGSPWVKRTESDVLLQKGLEQADINTAVASRESLFLHEQGATPQVNRDHRRSLAQLFHPNISASDFPSPTIESATSARVAPFPSPTSTPSYPSPKDLKLSRRRSMTQLFGLARKSGTDVSHGCNSSASSELAAPSPRQTLPPHAGEVKVSKRKSMTQLFGIGRKASRPTLAEVSAVGTSVDQPTTDRAEVRSAALRGLEGSESDWGGLALSRTTTSPSYAAAPVELSQEMNLHFPMPTSTSSDYTNKRMKRPKSFLEARTFDFFDLSRSPTASKAPAQIGAGFPSGATDLPCTPTSTDSETEVDGTFRIVEPHIEVPSHVTLPQQAGRATAGNGSMAPSLRDQSDKEELEEIDLSLRFSLYESRDVDYEGQVDDPSPLELAARLDSLNFEQLTFDPASFACR